MALPRSVVLCLVLVCSPLAGATALKKPAKRQEVELTDAEEAAMALNVAINAALSIYVNPTGTLEQFRDAVADVLEAAEELAGELAESQACPSLAVSLPTLQSTATAFLTATAEETPAVGVDLSGLYTNLVMTMEAVQADIQVCFPFLGQVPVIDDKRSAFVRV